MWVCYAHTMPLVYPGVTCHAAGEHDRDAEKHTRATGHPTTSGTLERGVAWARKAT